MSKSTNKPNGRPSKFTPERCASILDSISKYVPVTLAAEATGICKDTFYEWLKVARADRQAGKDTEYTDFSDALKKIETDKIKHLCANVEAGVDRWQSCAWLLERRWREYFGQDAGIIAELQATFAELKAKVEEQQQPKTR